MSFQPAVSVERNAKQIWREAHDCLETLDIIGLPKVEESDFRESLEHIRDLAEQIGGKP